MRGGRKTKSLSLKEKMEPSWPLNYSGTARNLNKSDLGGVIFGCTQSTIDECFSRELFGLPSRHISYIRNIDPGLPLFLFNYSDRKLHGIFEAASKGMLNINSSAWSADGSDSTPYAAQVKFRIHMECQPLLEDQFSTIISDNYYELKLFWFELDQKQTRNLISLFSSSRLLRSELLCSSMENSISPVNLDRGCSKWGSCSLNISSFGGDKKLLDPLKSDMAAKVCLEKPLSMKTWSSLFKGSATSEGKKEPEDFRTPETKFTLPSTIQSNMEFESSKFLASSDSQTELLYPQKNQWENYIEPVTMLNHINEVSNSSATNAMIGKGDGFVEIQALEINTHFANKSNMARISSCDNQNLIEESQDFNVLAKCRCNNLEWCICTTSISGESPSFLASKEELALEEDHRKSIPLQLKGSKGNCLFENAMDFEMVSSGSQSFVAQLLELVEHMKLCQLKQEQTISAMEQDQVESRIEIQRLKERCRILECYTHIEISEGETVIDSNDRSHLNLDGSILIVGGWNGRSWSSTLECYHHSLNFWKPITSMRSARLYSSAVKLDNEVYILGGKSDDWDTTVESYNLESCQWFSRPQFNQSKRNLAGVTLSSKIFAIGGANELEYFSDVEMLDLNVGKWIPIQSMTHKRFALAAAEIGGVLYAVGGYDGKNYLKSVERLDPREFSWRTVENMSTMRACLSLAIIGEKLYAVGGYDGNKMVSTVEVFDLRKGSWMMAESMHDCRGYFDSVVLGDNIYAIGGLENGNKILDTVECYKEGRGWEVTNLKAVGKRCYFSAMVI